LLGIIGGISKKANIRIMGLLQKVEGNVLPVGKSPLFGDGTRESKNVKFS
jgi:hypothetical protein